VSHPGTVPQCFNDDNASEWKSGKWNLRSLINPWTDIHRNLHGLLCRGLLAPGKISQRYDYPIASQICETAHQATRQFLLVLLSAYCPDFCAVFSPSIPQITRFRTRVCLFLGHETKIVNFRLHFPTKAHIFRQFSTGLRLHRSKRESYIMNRQIWVEETECPVNANPPFTGPEGVRWPIFKSSTPPPFLGNSLSYRSQLWQAYLQLRY